MMPHNIYKECLGSYLTITFTQIIDSPIFNESFLIKKKAFNQVAYMATIHPNNWKKGQLTNDETTKCVRTMNA